MANNKSDIDTQDTLHDKETPFGVWKAAPTSSPAGSSEQEAQTGPNAVITSEDGSQRPAQPDEIKMQPFAGQSTASQPDSQDQNNGIKSFSATFGVSPASTAAPLPPVDELTDKPEHPAESDKRQTATEQPQEQKNKTVLMRFDPSMLGKELIPDEEEAQPPTEPTPLPEVLRKEAEKPDPFAWSPEEAPTNPEPRRRTQLGEDAAWLDPATDYPGLQEPETAVAQTTDKPEESEKLIPEPQEEPAPPAVNPFTYGQKEQWEAPPMIANEATNAAEEKSATKESSQPAKKDEAPVTSPFDFAADNRPIEQQAETAGQQPPVADPLLSPDSSPAQPAITPELADAAPSPHEAPPENSDKNALHADKEQVAPQTTFQLEDTLPEDTMPAPQEEQPIAEEAQPSDAYSGQLQSTLATEDNFPVVDNANMNSESPFVPNQTETHAEFSSADTFDNAQQADETPFIANEDMQSSTASSSPFAEPEPFNAELPQPSATEDYSFSPYTEEEQTEPLAGTNGHRQFSDSTIHHILQEHMHWLHSAGKGGRRANFRNANLQGFDFSNAQLAEASLRGANLSGANLSGANLHGADLSEAVLDGTNFSNASLAAAILTHADLRTAYLTGADMQGADISGAMLIGVNLAGLNFADAILQDANLQNANLTQANLQNANLRGANLMGANLNAALLSYANCRDVSFDQAILDYAVFDGTNMKNASMQGASLIGVNIAAAEEVSAEHQQESLYAEKNHIQQEWERIKTHENTIRQLQAQIQQREMVLQNERASIERAKREMQGQVEGMQSLVSKTYEIMARHRIHDRRMKYIGIMWFLLTSLVIVGIMLLVKALEINELDWVSLAIVIAGCSLVMGLVTATTIRSIKMSNNLKQLLEIYDKQFFQQDNTGQ